MNAHELQRLLKQIRQSTRVLSRSEDGMSVTVGTGIDWTRDVKYGRGPRSKSAPFRKR